MTSQKRAKNNEHIKCTYHNCSTVHNIIHNRHQPHTDGGQVMGEELRYAMYR